MSDPVYPTWLASSSKTAVAWAVNSLSHDAVEERVVAALATLGFTVTVGFGKPGTSVENLLTVYFRSQDDRARCEGVRIPGVLQNELELPSAVQKAIDAGTVHRSPAGIITLPPASAAPRGVPAFYGAAGAGAGAGAPPPPPPPPSASPPSRSAGGGGFLTAAGAPYVTPAPAAPPAGAPPARAAPLADAQRALAALARALDRHFP